MKLPEIDSTTAVVLADGAYPEREDVVQLLETAPYVVCCDGAADLFAARGCTPSAIVGDCDSISADLRRRFAAIMHPDPEQSTNDLTKAVDFCVSNGYAKVVIFGATGLREDHTVANISLLCRYMERADVAMVSDYGIFTPIDGRAEFESFAGQQVSVFTLEPRTRLWYTGLKYELPDGYARSWWQGTLNESLGDRFTVRSDSKAIVFRAF